MQFGWKDPLMCSKPCPPTFTLSPSFSFSAIQMILSCDLGQTHTHSHTSICLHLEWTNSHSLSHSFPLSPQSRLFLPLSSLLLFPFLWNLKISHPDCVLYILLPWWLPCRASKMSVCVCLRVCVCMYNVCLCASSSTISQAQILKLFSEETTIKGETPTIPFL